MKVLVTGSAGFIGFHLVNRLLEVGYEVVGLDNINDYYDVKLKYARLANSGILKDKIEWGKAVKSTQSNYKFYRLNLEDKESISALFKNENFDLVCHLAAQAGVRYSLINPHAYINSNIVGFINILEGCRQGKIKHLVYASSSSVYGLNKKIPFSISDNVDHPISLYAATKKSNELMAHTYSHLYNIPTTGLRFFTVYGPWGRPDMAISLFTKAIMEGKPIKVFNYGDMKRDFTYVDDIVEGVLKSIDLLSSKALNLDNVFTSNIPYQIHNIGNGQPISLMDFIACIEDKVNKKAIIEKLPMQDGDVKETFADISSLKKATNFQPKINLELGVARFVDWYKEYRKDSIND